MSALSIAEAFWLEAEHKVRSLEAVLHKAGEPTERQFIELEFARAAADALRQHYEALLQANRESGNSE